MIKLFRFHILWVVICLMFLSCSNINKTGRLINKDFFEEVDFDELLGLAIIDVEIKGQTFRFLFDTGAPNAISNEIQSKFEFPIVGDQGMRDSQGSRNSVQYAKIDELHIGGVIFQKMNAFVTDFNSNPIIKCLEIDGIIGSPLMRHCIWQVDYSDRAIRITDQLDSLDYWQSKGTEFETDDQYSIILAIDLEKAVIKNLKIDYGSTSGLTIPESSFTQLEEVEVFDDETTISHGYSQSGLFGKVDETKTRHNRLSGRLGISKLNSASTKTRKKSGGLVGTEILRDFIVTMDYPSQELYFHQVDSSHTMDHSLGFNLGRSYGITYVLSVIENSVADQAGLNLGDTLQTISGYSVLSEKELCDYILRDTSIPKDTVEVVGLRNGVEIEYQLPRK